VGHVGELVEGMFMLQLDVLQLAVDDVLVEYVFDKWPLTGGLDHVGVWFMREFGFFSMFGSLKRGWIANF